MGLEKEGGKAVKRGGRVVVTRALPVRVEERMREVFEEVWFSGSREAPGREEFLEMLRGARAVITTLGDVVDEEALAAGEGLGLVANYGAGVDHIDVKAAHARGIVVTNTPDVLTYDTADAAMGLMLMMMRRFDWGARYMRREGGGWRGWTPRGGEGGGELGTSLSGKKLGVVGLGRTGAATARRARGFGMEVIYTGRRRASRELEEETGARWFGGLEGLEGVEGLEGLMKEADVVSLHCPLTRETEGLLSRERLGLMKEGSYVVNAARGGLVDEEALCDLLEGGRLGGAGLDVYEREPRVNVRLLGLMEKGLVLGFPHMGSATREAREAMGEAALENARAFLEGRSPPNRVYPDLVKRGDDGRGW